MFFGQHYCRRLKQPSTDNNAPNTSVISMRMTKLIISIFLLSISVGAHAFEVYENGFGKIKLNQSVTEVQKLLGENLYLGRDLDEDEFLCHQLVPKSIKPEVYLMIEEDILTRIDVYSKGITSPKGLSVGDKESVVYKHFKNVEKRVHPYVGKDGAYVVVSYRTSELLFEIVGGYIVSFRVGIEPSVFYIEGCL